jgi:hypothetical protein
LFLESRNTQIFWLCVVWPIFAFFKVCLALKHKLVDLKIKQKENEENLNKIRIAKQKEEAILLQESDEEVENDLRHQRV